jgi:sterol desaturase/sphingolipid hydroxylase (fatty acid hydroxylase superfamily)
MTAPAHESAVSVRHLPTDASMLTRVIFWALQPALLLGVLATWIADPENPALFGLTFLGVHLLLGALEYRIPARPHWRHPATEKLVVLGIAVVSFMVGGAASGLYETYLTAPLDAIRATLHLDLWPHHWPLVPQALLVFFLSEFIWYWIHRAEHRWTPVWRLSGHGAHHAFKKLNAINAGANHPIELFLIVLPAIFVDLLFGVGAAAYGAVLLTLVQTAVVHSNLRLNSIVIGWLFTTNAWHIRHHSADLAESNTNYGCAAIVWDRVFGTFGDSAVVEAGVGPREPTTLEKLLMPLREPEGSVIAPTERRITRAP